MFNRDLVGLHRGSQNTVNDTVITRLNQLDNRLKQLELLLDKKELYKEVLKSHNLTVNDINKMPKISQFVRVFRAKMELYIRNYRNISTNIYVKNHGWADMTTELCQVAEHVVLIPGLTTILHAISAIKRELTERKHKKEMYHINKIFNYPEQEIYKIIHAISLDIALYYRDKINSLTLKNVSKLAKYIVAHVLKNLKKLKPLMMESHVLVEQIMALIDPDDFRLGMQVVVSGNK